MNTNTLKKAVLGVVAVVALGACGITEVHKEQFARRSAHAEPR
ncbi:MAG: hypothetical protein ACKOQZ_08295 [Actinomycetota bacterium]